MASVLRRFAAAQLSGAVRTHMTHAGGCCSSTATPVAIGVARTALGAPKTAVSVKRIPRALSVLFISLLMSVDPPCACPSRAAHGRQLCAGAVDEGALVGASYL